MAFYGWMEIPQLYVDERCQYDDALMRRSCLTIFLSILVLNVLSPEWGAGLSLFLAIFIGLVGSEPWHSAPV